VAHAPALLAPECVRRWSTGRQLWCRCRSGGDEDAWSGEGPTPLVRAPCRQRLANRPAASKVRRNGMRGDVLARRPFCSKSSHIGDLGLRARAKIVSRWRSGSSRACMRCTRKSGPRRTRLWCVSIHFALNWVGCAGSLCRSGSPTHTELGNRYLESALLKNLDDHA
jgi:hypothetical protein